MAVIQSLIVRIGADVSALHSGLAKASGKVSAFGTQVTNAGRALTTGITVPVVGAGIAAAKGASKFEREMSKIEGSVGVSRKQVDKWSDTILKKGPLWGRPPQELAEAMYFVASAGIRGSDAMDVVELSAKAATAGLGETKVIADLTTSAMNAYKDSGLTAADATDILAAAVREGKLESDELAGAMGRVFPVASGMGVGLDEVGAAMASMSKTGTGANEAATQLRGILNSILKPSKEAEDTLNAMGLSSEGLRKQIKEEGLLSVLETLTDKFKGNESGIAKVFGNVRALSGVMDMMGGNVDDTRRIFGEMENSTGALDEAFSAAAKTAGFKWDVTMAQVKTSLIEIGKDLLPMVKAALEAVSGWVGELMKWWRRLSKEQKENIVKWLGIAAAIGPVLLIFGSMIKVVGAVIGIIKGAVFVLKLLMGPVGIILLVAAALVFAYMKSETFRKVVHKALDFIIKAAKKLWEWIKVAFEGMKVAFSAVGRVALWLWKNAIQPAFNGISTAVKAVATAGKWLWQNVLKPAFNGISTAVKFVAAVVAAVAKGISAAFDAVAKAAKWLWQKVLKPVFNFISVAVRLLAVIVGTILVVPFVLWFKLMGAVAKWLWNNAIKPAIAQIVGAVQWLGKIVAWLWKNAVKPAIEAIGKVFTWLWKNVAKPAFDGIGNLIKFAWNRIIKPTWNTLKLGVEEIGKKFTWLKNNVVKPVWDWIKDKLQSVWRERIRPTWNKLKSGVEEMGKKFSWFKENVIKPVWDWIKDKIKNTWENRIKPVFRNFKKGLENLKEAFRNVKDAIGRIWDQIKQKTMKPIRWVVNTVYNNGIRKVWNKIADAVGLKDKKLPKVSIGGGASAPSFSGSQSFTDASRALNRARGGVIPGVDHGRDEHLVMMRGNEAAMVPAFTRAVGGPTGVDQLNRMAEKGQLRALMGNHLALPVDEHFAKGGVVRPVSGGSISSHYGPRSGGFHTGVDFAKSSGSIIRSAMAGVVNLVRRLTTSYGHHVGVDHGGGVSTLYAHMSKILTSVGSRVNAGTTLGRVGSTGNSSGPHLHFEVRKNGRHVNPMSFLGGDKMGATGAGGGILSNLWKSVKTAGAWIKDKTTAAMEFIQSPVGIVKKFVGEKMKRMLGSFGEKSPWVSMIKAIPRRIVGGLVDKAKGWASSLVPDIGSQGSGVDRWRGVGLQALQEAGAPTSWLGSLMRRMNQESGGNPNAVNKWDSNWRAGHPSVGLMQVIGPTFRAYAGKYRNRGPFMYGTSTNPLANIYSAIKYTVARYGSGPAGWDRPGGYKNGGWLKPNGLAYNETKKPEAIFNRSQLNILRDAAVSNAERNSGGREEQVQYITNVNVREAHIDEKRLNQIQKANELRRRVGRPS